MAAKAQSLLKQDQIHNSVAAENEKFTSAEQKMI